MYSYTRIFSSPNAQYPSNGTKFGCCTLPRVSISAKNSLFPCVVEAPSFFIATVLPSGSVALYTVPKPPSPITFVLQNLLVACEQRDTTTACIINFFSEVTTNSQLHFSCKVLNEILKRKKPWKIQNLINMYVPARLGKGRAWAEDALQTWAVCSSSVAAPCHLSLLCLWSLTSSSAHLQLQQMSSASSLTQGLCWGFLESIDSSSVRSWGRGEAGWKLQHTQTSRWSLSLGSSRFCYHVAASSSGWSWSSSCYIDHHHHHPAQYWVDELGTAWNKLLHQVWWDLWSHFLKGWGDQGLEEYTSLQGRCPSGYCWKGPSKWAVRAV